MKKFLNGISRTLCVMAISVFAVCIFAGCNYAGDNAGTPPVISQPEKVLEPAFSLQPGEVDYGDTVAIRCAIEGASIYYTTDGTDPSAESSSYTSSIEITSDTTIKAFATKFGMTSSEVAVASYTVKKYTITFNANGHGIAPDAFTGKHKGEKITLQELSETGYTFDGWTDGENNFAAGTEYIITSDVTLKAKWIGWNDGTTDYAAGADYTVAGDVTIKAVWKEIPNVTNLTATCPASGTVKLTWTNPTDADFVKVVITYDTDKSVTVLKTDSPNNEVTITGLTNGTEYTFTVKTYDNSENASNGVSEKATHQNTSGTQVQQATGRKLH
ncbi:MAG: chitobiase/beta-hexosaminidase C-terminal domain-containing protein [Treponema sp.]|nr:chitobiase/beta-hexosaminidase C-terminal domain-containing protein [Candidatus Treponema scatequi]